MGVVVFGGCQVSVDAEDREILIPECAHEEWVLAPRLQDGLQRGIRNVTLVLKANEFDG